MDRPTAEAAIKMLLIEIREDLEKATSVAKAAEACALTGNVAQGARVALSFEQLVYEANRLLAAASLINRLSQDG
jgi:hypothetical protein